MESKISIKFVYEFSELSDEVKERVIEKHYMDEDYPFLTEDIEQELQNIAPYWEDVKLNYSLSYCQGDGLSFSGSLNIGKFLDTFFPNLRRKNVVKEYIYKIYSTGNKGHYSYASERDIDFDLNYTSGKEYKRIDKLTDSIIQAVRKDYLRTCKTLEKYGYSILEYRMNNAEFQEFCEANDFKFTEQGKLVF